MWHDHMVVSTPNTFRRGIPKRYPVAWRLAVGPVMALMFGAALSANRSGLNFGRIFLLEISAYG
ncbi:MAG: hypothetical protein HOI22_07315 [Tateyamaria sp.]|jgi:uncharacterized protein YaaW (UPF0174 family)|nr:hypothetical protein [Tateyamaria sp.]MDG1183802.1 hypothetical protein [Tateyamaria sp.]MDG1336600.1 hypothetical protein [Tateyamaria sp.]MDG2057977.1 hypothetical protein [Tateyamaria sp.]